MTPKETAPVITLPLHFDQRLRSFSAARLLMKQKSDDLRARISDVSAEKAALNVHDALEKPWNIRWVRGTRIPEMESFPFAHAFLDKVLSTGVFDAHFELRGNVVNLMLRTSSQVTQVPGEEGHAIYKDLMDFLDQSLIHFSQAPAPAPAGVHIATPLFPIKLRFQSSPVYPQGTDILLRILPGEPILSPEVSELRAVHTKQREQLMERYRDRLDRNVSDYQKERIEELGPTDNALHKALFLAIEQNKPRSVAKLLAAGASPHLRGPATDSTRGGFSMQTPLIMAARLGYAQIVQALLPVSDIDAVDANGETALTACAQSGENSCVTLLAPLSLIDAQNFNGRSALAEAAWTKKTTTVRILAPLSQVNLGEHCHLPLPGETPDPGNTALSIAAQEGYSAICKILLSYGADPRLVDSSGETAITQFTRLDDKTLRLIEDRAHLLDEHDALVAHIPEGSSSATSIRL